MWARRSQAVLWHLYGTRCRYSTGAPLNLVSTRYGDPSKDCQRPPLVICHGMFGQKQNWNSVSKAMQRRLACTIYAVDLRNHGDSPWADSMKYEEMCEDVVAFLKTISKETGFSKCHLLGHSMGGRVVMRLAIEPSWQNLIDRLVVEDVSPKTYPADFTYHMGFRKYIHAMAALDMSRSRRDLLRDLEGIVPDKAVREFLLTNLEPSDVSGVSKWRCNLKAIDSNLETLMRFEMPLGNFKGPTLFVYGEKSEYVKDDDKNTGAPLNLVSTRYGDPNKDCQRPPLVICHGLFGQKRNWKSVSKAMQQRLACTIYAVDLRNHGQSPWADSMKYEEMCEDMVAFLKTVSKETGFSKCRLLGHSMGGRLVMRLAIEPTWQNLIDRLIVEDVSPKAYSAGFIHRMGFRKYIHAMAALDMRKSRRDLLRDLEGVVSDEAIREFLLTNLEPSEVPGVSRLRCNLKAIDSNLEALMGFHMPSGKFNGPTLVVYAKLIEHFYLKMKRFQMTDCGGEQKLLSELRVTELKQELEKRNLDKNGIKIILTDRLEKALLADGHDPATYLFRVNEPAVSSDGNAKPMSPSATPMETADGENDLQISENGNAAGDKHQDTEQMETDADSSTKDNDKKTDDLNDSKGLVIADDQTAVAATTNDEEMLEDPLVDVPAEAAPASAKPSDNKVTAQSSVKTPVQAPVNDDKEKDVASRSIWVRGLTSATKAADLKVLCTQYGKVVRAKIYTSKKQSTSACYGYVTMADSASADKAAAAMHKTQVKGRTISVEKADKSKVPAVKSAASTVAPAKKDGTTNESKRDAEKKGKDAESKTKAASEKSQNDAKGKTATASTSSKREEARSSDRKRDDKEKRTSTGDRRDSERPSRSSDAKREVARRSAARDPRRGAQRTITAARRFPTRGVSSYSLRGRVTRPGDRGAFMSSIRRPEAMSQRDLLTMLRHKEEEHRRREAEIEKERALERERERIRFEREQLEKERLQLQLQAALQQQKLAAMNSSRTKDSYAPSSRLVVFEQITPSGPVVCGLTTMTMLTQNTTSVMFWAKYYKLDSAGSRHAEYRSSRDGRGEKMSSSSSHHRSTGDSRRGAPESRSRHGGSGDRSDRDRSEHKATSATSRERSRHDSYGSSSRSARPASYSSSVKDYDRGYASSRGTHSYSNGRGSSSYFGNSRDAYSSSSRPAYGSSSSWVGSGGSGLGGHSSSTSAWTRGATGAGGWAAFGSGGGGGSSGVRYDYDKYQQRF
ncbi:hypothetical protein GCK32_006200 [Trichostrongylus colubriformis]|uniref:sn-1-specific diacylglycerol lipase ABHD11 n=1 Tax=Trichostrongylus colubriformis TaxID=6319 RepID=A0AAN8FZ68_TRICO